MPKLIVCRDAQDYRVVEFGISITIGRGEENDIALASPLVSRQHASISQREDGTYVLFDHKSANAVWLGNKKVNAIRLTHGMTFRIVDYFFTFINEQNDNHFQRVLTLQGIAPKRDLASVDSATILFDLEQGCEELLLEPDTSSLLEESANMASLKSFLLELHGVDEESLLKERLLDKAMELLRAERGFIALLNEKNELVYAATRGFDPHKESREFRQDVVQQVMDRGCGIAARSMLCAPLLREGTAMGCLYLDRGGKNLCGSTIQNVLEILTLHGGVLLDNLMCRKRIYRERESLKARLAAKDETIIRSEKMIKLYEDIRTIAAINVPVFISGEAGCGKEHVAAAIHSFSQRKGACLPLNCAAIPEGIFESELFGSRKGAFHEAIDKPGKLELAEGGTLFLDEVADMSLVLQPKLLRFLENGEITRLGDTRTKKLDVRVVTATNKDVEGMIREHTFRDDLFQRLSCFTLKVPPLRERVEDIEPLTRYFLKKFSGEYNWKEPRISDNGMQVLRQLQWPGNIRQLRNVLLRLAVQSQGRLITDKEILDLSAEFGSAGTAKVDIFLSLEELEKNHIKAALDRTGGNIIDAAGLVGIARSTLYIKMKKYDISA